MKIRGLITPSNRRTAFVVVALLSGVGAALALVLLSPFLLIWVGAVRAEDWNRLSAIGQTYGAASTILSALALGGVALSLIIQSRDGRADQIASVREFHRELLEITSQDPEQYLPSWGWNLGEDVSTELAQAIMFTHMIVNYLSLGFRLGVITEEQLRLQSLKHLFSGDAGRQYWERMGREIALGRAGRPYRRFTSIAEDVYAEAVARGPAVIPVKSGSEVSRQGARPPGARSRRPRPSAPRWDWS